MSVAAMTIAPGGLASTALSIERRAGSGSAKRNLARSPSGPDIPADEDECRRMLSEEFRDDRGPLSQDGASLAALYVALYQNDSPRLEVELGR